MIVRPQLQGAIVVQASSPADPDNAKGVQARRPHHKTAATLPCLPPVTEALAMIFGASNQAKDGPVRQEYSVRRQECSVHVSRASRPREQSWCEGKKPSLRAGELVLRSELLRRVATPATRSQHSRAFTLAELMIAIGIMGIGLVMVMALFPAALKENASSVHDVMGSLICKNAIAIAKAQLHKDAIVSPSLQVISPSNYGYGDTYPNEVGIVASQSGNKFMAASSAGNKAYPPDCWKGYSVEFATKPGVYYPIAGNTNAGEITVDAGSPAIPSPDAFRIVSKNGFVLLGRKVNTDPASNDFQLMAIAYQKEEVANTVEVHQISAITHPGFNVPVGEGKLEFDYPQAEDGFIVIGSPVIDIATGDYATIIAKNDKTYKAYLDHELRLDASTGPATNVYVVTESPAGVRSPVISVLTTRTSLRP